MKSGSHLIQARELVRLAEGGHDFVLIDARAGQDARERYRAGHLRGALHVHLEEELSDIHEDLRKGGRHPLPSPQRFSVFLGRLGIGPGSHVVVCDDQGGANAAARFWWMLKAMGHEKVQLLDGGMQSALRSGYPPESGEGSTEPMPPYSGKDWELPTAGMEEVARAAAHPDYLVVDVRGEARYLGIEEPIDTIAGHIPGAVNMPYENNLDDDGLFLPPSRLHEMYSKLTGGRPASQVILHCGSGVTACHSALAMAAAGWEIPPVYTGSWSEWSRNGRAVAREV